MIRPGQTTAMVSSTAVDLPQHRKQVLDACLREGIFPIGMEQLPARDATGVQVSLEMVDQADLYLGVYAWRYGWVPDGSNISITEMEFNRALERKESGDLKEILVFLMHEDHPSMRRDVETDATAQERLRRFKERAASGRVRGEFRSAEELRGLVVQALADFKLRREGSAKSLVGTDPKPSHKAPDVHSGLEGFERRTGPIAKELLLMLFTSGMLFAGLIAVLTWVLNIPGVAALCALCFVFIVLAGAGLYCLHLINKGYQSPRQEELRVETRRLRTMDFAKFLPELTRN